MTDPENRRRAISVLMLIDMPEGKTQSKMTEFLWVKDWLLKIETNGSFNIIQGASSNEPPVSAANL